MQILAKNEDKRQKIIFFSFFFFVFPVLRESFSWLWSENAEWRFHWMHEPKLWGGVFLCLKPSLSISEAIAISVVSQIWPRVYDFLAVKERPRISLRTSKSIFRERSPCQHQISGSRLFSGLCSSCKPTNDKSVQGNKSHCPQEALCWTGKHRVSPGNIWFTHRPIGIF